MAFEGSNLTITLTAASDLSSKQYYFVAVDSNAIKVNAGNVTEHTEIHYIIKAINEAVDIKVVRVIHGLLFSLL